MRISGVIEGFYGTPWSHTDRLAWIDRLDDRGMTHLVWAAKEEPRHRTGWRDPFTAQELEEFAELAHRRPGVTFAVGLTPGPDATTDDVVGKLAPAARAGAGAVVLSCDDLPALGAGAVHRDLAHALLDSLGCEVWIVPTHYCGADDSPYLQSLTAGLDPSVELMWTGLRVVNDRIDAADARRWAELIGRPPLVWDNTPVADGLMAEALHLGPLAGRDPLLRDVCSGVLWNPMHLPIASSATLASAAGWCRGDDPDDAWRSHVEALGWTALAEATAFRGDPHWPGDEPDASWWHSLVARLPEHAADVGLDEGAQPWIDAAREGAAIALDALAIVERMATRGTGTGTTLRQFTLVRRWRDWQRSPVLTFGAGPRVRPVLGQDARGEFVAEPAAFDWTSSLVERAVRRAVPS